MRKCKIIVVLLLVFGCKKSEKPNVSTATPLEFKIDGTWDDYKHVINGTTYEVNSSLNLKNDGTYFDFGFTYPWHCIPGANSDDNGSWTYNKTTKKLTIVTNKPPLGSASNFSQVTMEVISLTENELIVNFISPACTNQHVEVTFKR
jgi:hypothetical protein